MRSPPPFKALCSVCGGDVQKLAQAAAAAKKENLIRKLLKSHCAIKNQAKILHKVGVAKVGPPHIISLVNKIDEGCGG